MSEPKKTKDKRIDRVVATLIGGPLEPGTLVKAEVFEEMLGLSRHSQAFSWLISHIRHGLYEYGIYLSGEGFSQTGAFEIYHPRDIYWVLRMAIERTERDLEGKLTLGINTKMDGLSQLEKKRHENVVRELSMKLSAMRQALEVEDMFKKSKTKKLKPVIPAEHSTAEPSRAEPSQAQPSIAKHSAV